MEMLFSHAYAAHFQTGANTPFNQFLLFVTLSQLASKLQSISKQSHVCVCVCSRERVYVYVKRAILVYSILATFRFKCEFTSI